MDDEKMITGYCRILDQSRIVTVEITNGAMDTVDCCYGSCPHQGSCKIAAQIDEIPK